MRTNCRSVVSMAAFAAVVVGGVGAGVAMAAPTGNPAADGWISGGNAMANGSYIRGAGLWSFEMYASNMTLAPGSALLNTVGGSTWNPGDEVIGLGGVFTAAPSAPDNGWGPFSSYTGATNTNTTSSLRMLGKFGSDPAAWSASTLVPGNGNGNGSHSGGFGGLGSVLLANSAADLGSFASGSLRLPSVAQIYTGASAININPAVGRMMYIYDSSTLVSSWQLFLNVSLLDSLYGGTYADLPAWGDRHSISLQRGTNSTLLQDSMMIPAPGAAVMLGLFGLSAARRRR